VHPNALNHGQIADAADHGLMQANRSLEITGSAPKETRCVHDPPFPPSVLKDLMDFDHAIAIG
jgi:hypothetical protein